LIGERSSTEDRPLDSEILSEIEPKIKPFKLVRGDSVGRGGIEPPTFRFSGLSA
jgi:hypothetical protein